MRRRAARGPGPWADRRVAGVRRSPYDGEIVRLALPALGALAAEPLYLLVDTAIVGHLGTPQLAALALAATVLSNARRAVHLPDLRDDGPRRRGCTAPARTRTPPRSAPQAFWLALARRGGRSTAVVAALAEPLVDALGGDGHVADMAARYLRHRVARRADGARRAGGPGLAARHGRPAHAARDRRRRQRRQRRARGAVRLRLRLGPRRLGAGARCSRSSGWGSRSRRAAARVRRRARSRAHPLAGVDRRPAVRAHAALLGCFVLATAVLRAHRRGDASPPTRSPSSSSASWRSCSTRSPSPGRSSSAARWAPATPTRPSPPRGA